jgi:hypothetical protein
MTRKHFELIAKVLGENIAEQRVCYAHDRRNGEVMQSALRDKANRAAGASNAAHMVMEALESTNDLFDRERFWEAVGKAERAASDKNRENGREISPIRWIG